MSAMLDDFLVSLIPPHRLYRQIDFISNVPYSEAGQFATVYKGRLKATAGLAPREVAFKRPRWGTADQNLLEPRLAAFKEVEKWLRLEHPNVLEFIGLYLSGGDVYMISPFAHNGTVVDYLRKSPDANRIELIKGVTSGLAYLHQQGIIHGDVKGANILVGNDYRAQLCDFGFSKFLDAAPSRSVQAIGTLRYLSPERMMQAMARTIQSDVYAYGMTLYEILSGQQPFGHLKEPAGIIMAACIQGERPPQRPPTSSDGTSYGPVWSVATQCWQHQPGARISMDDAKGALDEAY